MKKTAIDRNARFNVTLTGQQDHIKDRFYEDVSLDSVLYIIENNIAADYLQANGEPTVIDIPTKEKQMLDTDYKIEIELID